VSACTLKDVLLATQGSVLGSANDLQFDRVGTDTRTTTSGDLFVALRGQRFDGHRFLAEAARKGARAAMVDSSSDLGAGLPLIVVKDTISALGDLASTLARGKKASRLAVTGSNGKTTTKELLRAALSAKGRTVASHKSFNNFVGVPLTLLQIEPGTDFAVLELGTNHRGEIARLSALASPWVGVITNCGQAHVGPLGGVQGVVEEKGALLDALPGDGVAVLNADDASIDAFKERAHCRVVTFGIRQKADYRAVDIRFDLRRLCFHLQGERVFVPLGGCHNVYNSLAAIAAAEAVGVSRAAAIRSLRRIEGPPMRLTPLRTRRFCIIDDCYNANPGSVEAAFRTLAAVHSQGRKVVVLGDMLELGEQSEELHRAAGRWVSLLPLDLLVAVGRFSSFVREGALLTGFPEDRVRVCADARSAARLFEDEPLLRSGDTILVKASRSMTLEVLVEALQLLGEKADAV